MTYKIVEADDSQLDDLRRKVRAARKWLEEYYAANKVPGSDLWDNRVEIRHGSATVAFVAPYLLGQRSLIKIQHVLGFRKDGSVVWHVINPITEREMTQHVITAKEIEDICAKYENSLANNH